MSLESPLGTQGQLFLGCLNLAVRFEGANHQWRKNPPGELSIDPVADERLVRVTARGVASFNLLRGRAREAQAFVWAFDLIELDGEDLRNLPFERRKGELKAVLKRAPFGLALNDYVAGP